MTSASKRPSLKIATPKFSILGIIFLFTASFSLTPFPSLYVSAQDQTFSTIRGQNIFCRKEGEKSFAIILQRDGRFTTVQGKLSAIERRIRSLRSKRNRSLAENRRLSQLRGYRSEWKSVLQTSRKICSTDGNAPDPFGTMAPETPTPISTEQAPSTPTIVTSTPPPTNPPPGDPMVTPAPTPTLQPGTGGLGYPNDANIIDIVRDYGADPSGTIDATSSINRALRDHNATSSAIYPVNPRTIFFPKGTYLISDTIFTESTYFPGAATSTIRLLGEDRGQTILKLRDNSPGFSEGTTKYVLQTANYGSLKFTPAPTPSPNPTPSSPAQPNSGFGNYIENLTIDTGIGNPGAVALRYDVANMGTLQDVTIRSGDGGGKYGIQFFTNSGPGYVNRVTIDGFTTGIIFGPTPVNNIVFEAIDISNSTTGIENAGKNIQIRALKTRNVSTPILTRNKHAVTILIDADFQYPTTSTPRTPPIQIQDEGFFFGRNIIASNRFPSVISHGTKNVVGVNQINLGTRLVQEWSSQPATKGASTIPYSLQGKTVYSLNLPVKDSPQINVLRTPGYNSWANVTAPAFGAVSGDSIDDTAAFQAAIDSGLPIVYAPYGRYLINGTLHITKNVERIDFLFSYIEGTGTIKIGPFDSTSKAEYVLLENLVSSGGINIQHHANKPVTIRNVKARMITSSASAIGDLFVENSGPRTSFELAGPPTWIRQMNREVVGFRNLGAKVWVLGDNLEGKGADIAIERYPYQPSFVTTSGGSTEILGGAVDALRYYARDRDKTQPLYSAVTNPQDLNRSRISVVAGSLEIQAVSGKTGKAIVDKDGQPVFGSWDTYFLDDAPPDIRVLLSDAHGAKSTIGTSQRRSFISLYSSE